MCLKLPKYLWVVLFLEGEHLSQILSLVLEFSDIRTFDVPSCIENKLDALGHISP